MSKETTIKTQLPKLRFPEFMDMGKWEKKLVEEYFNVGSSKRVFQKDWVNDGVPFYRTRELVSLSKNESFGREIYISEELFLELSEKHGVPTKGDFLVSGVGTIGVSYQVKSGDKFYFKDGNVLWFKLLQGLVSDYFKYCLQSQIIQSQILGKASISTVGTYTIQNAKKTEFWLAYSPDEQQKIADCLSSIDDLITAQAKKIESLKDHKKGLMQQLFPAEGETVPKLRFPEFSMDWKVKNLEQLANIKTGGKDKEDKVNDGLYPFFVRSKTVEKINSFSYDGEAILTSGDGGVGKDFHYINGKFDFHQRVYCIFKFKNQVFGKYIYFYFSEKFNKRVMRMSAKNTVDSVRMDMVTKMKICIPTLIEQQKIADCLSSIDDLITAQAKKLELLKDHKKGLMQQLFPTADEVEQ